MPKEKPTGTNVFPDNIRKLFTIFSPGGALLEGKVTPAIKKATAAAKKAAAGK